MTVPIIIGGEKCGTLEMRRDGAFTLFTARCEPRPGLLRLSVFGQGGRGYLGVLQPQNGALYLRRRLSRAAMSGFPERIEYAGVEEQPGAGSKPEREATPPKRRPAPGGWIKRADGSLVRAEEGHVLLALPCALRRKVPGVDLREIEGRTYLVFRT